MRLIAFKTEEVPYAKVIIICVCSAPNEDNAVNAGNKSKDISYFHAALSVVQGGSNMTGTDLCVNKPHCAAAVRP